VRHVKVGDLTADDLDRHGVSLLCVEHVVYQDSADTRGHRAPPRLEVWASVIVQIVYPFVL
jgi:hypothetical protein